MGIQSIPVWKDWHMSFRNQCHFCSRWCTGPSRYFFPSCRSRGYPYFEATDFHHRHKLDLDNQHNRLGNWYYMDNLKQQITNEKRPSMKTWRIYIVLLTLNTFIQGSTTFQETIWIWAGESAVDISHFTLAFTLISKILIAKLEWSEVSNRTERSTLTDRSSDVPCPGNHSRL